MVESDPLRTQRDVTSAVTDELWAAGFEDVAEIGQGGFGVVFRCLQRALERTVAVKILTSTHDTENLERFLREQRAMGRLSGHPNIVRVYHVDVTDSGRPFIVMEYHPRGSLDTQIRRDGPLNWPAALRLGVKLAGALETAHRSGILHRDVKPANILVTDYGEPELSDFGIAHIAGGFQTSLGAVTATPAFTAPEVLKGELPGPASDIYSLASTLFCAITGHAAFERRNGEQVMTQFLRITTQPIPDLREKGIPDDVGAAIERAMSGSPEVRPATAAEFGDELREAQRRNDRPVDTMALPADDGLGRVSEATPVSVKDRVQDTPESSGTRGRSGNLPVNLTSFVNRRHEVAETRRLLSDSRLVTLTGLGGVGKTRLALRVAEDSRRAFEGGSWFVELGELQDSGLLVQAISGALGLQGRSTRPALTVLTEYLSERRTMLVLDNCEHLVEAVAALVDHLLLVSPGLRILATSREPIGIRGETVTRVPPLSVSAPRRGADRGDAVTLFEQRARAAVPGFTLTADNIDVVTQICQRLEGLPLAIELAAARLRAMSVEQILQRLSDRLRLLTLGSRGTPGRQQTLRLSLDWSHELCSAEERWLWSRLTVFAGSFELDAAEEVFADEPMHRELLDLVTGLVDRSILIREEPGAVVRYRMLETIRDYGREKLQESGAFDQMRRHHRDWYEQLVLRARSDWIGPRQVEWIARFEAEQPNLRDAMEFCLTEQSEDQAGMRIAAAMFPFWVARGRTGEGRHWLERALARDGGRPTANRVEAMCIDIILAGMQGDIAAGTVLIEKARHAAAQLGDPASGALVALASGWLATYSGELPRAVADIEEAIAVFRAADDLGYQVPALGCLSFVLGLGEDQKHAADCLGELIALTEPRGELMWRAMALSDRGFATWRRDGGREGIALLEEGLRLSQQVGDRYSCAWGIEQLAWTAADAEPNRAAVMTGAAATVFTEIGIPTSACSDVAPYHDECIRQAREVLDEKGFEAEYRRGGSMSIDAAIAYALNERPHPGPSAPADEGVSLTRRERQVTDLVAQGMSNKDIADKLVLAPSTVKGHVEHVLVKLGFTSRTQIAAWVVERKRDA
ncbi:protein kinase [Rhodococcus sp. T2V]|uniref:protein kinase domain-containing protein n=1 Tax=Rhodococcus sp. T2V TaxID=3034164 RepID=UPI0023E2A0F9|nr:protein kinase [Rhodococcus sp. T2V]MDF3306416.1 protein kinase [Rhodococcus sp. T2V]